MLCMTNETVFNLKTFVDVDVLREDIKVNPNDLQSAFYDQAAKAAHYGSQAVKAQHQADRCKQAMEIIEAQIDRELRDQAVGSKKPTEAEISKSILLDSRYQKAQWRFHEAREIAGLAREAANAFTHRRDMIVQAAKHDLEERKGEMRMTDNSLSDRMRSALTAR